MAPRCCPLAAAGRGPGAERGGGARGAASRPAIGGLSEESLMAASLQSAWCAAGGVAETDLLAGHCSTFYPASGRQGSRHARPVAPCGRTNSPPRATTLSPASSHPPARPLSLRQRAARCMCASQQWMTTRACPRLGRDGHRRGACPRCWPRRNPPGRAFRCLRPWLIGAAGQAVADGQST